MSIKVFQGENGKHQLFDKDYMHLQKIFTDLETKKSLNKFWLFWLQWAVRAFTAHWICTIKLHDIPGPEDRGHEGICPPPIFWQQGWVDLKPPYSFLPPPWIFRPSAGYESLICTSFFLQVISVYASAPFLIVFFFILLLFSAELLILLHLLYFQHFLKPGGN